MTAAIFLYIADLKNDATHSPLEVGRAPLRPPELGLMRPEEELEESFTSQRGAEEPPPDVFKNIDFH